MTGSCIWYTDLQEDQDSTSESSTTAQAGQVAATAAERNSRSNVPWQIIVSHPGIFTDMVKRYGVKDVVVKEAHSLVEELETPLAYGIILGYHNPRDQLPETPDESDEHEEDADNIIFSRRVTMNSSATLSLVNILANLDIKKGKHIRKLIEITRNMDSFNRGLALVNTNKFNKVHNKYIVTNPHHSDPHFVSYIPKDGFLWEMNSLKCHPTKLMAIGRGENWIELLDRKIKSEHLIVTTLAVMKDPITEGTKQLVQLKQKCTEQNPQKDDLERQIKKLEDDIAVLKNAEMEQSYQVKRSKEIRFPTTEDIVSSSVIVYYVRPKSSKRKQTTSTSNTPEGQKKKKGKETGDSKREKEIKRKRHHHNDEEEPRKK